MNTFVGGVVALVVGGGLAAATVLGIVSAQTSSNNEVPSQSQLLDYGTTNQ